MSTSWSLLAPLVALAFYVYLAWLKPVAKPNDPKEVATFAGWIWGAAVAALCYAWFWAATRGVSFPQALLGDEGFGAFWNFVGVARSMVILALLFSVHAFAALLLKATRGRDIGN